MTEIDLRQRIVNEAKTWLGVFWTHNGRARGGVDCAGLLYCVFSPFISLSPPPEYSIDFFLHQSDEKFRNYVEQYAVPLGMVEPQPADVCLYRVGRCLSHGAIVVEWPIVIHAWRKVGRVVLSEGDRGELGFRWAGVWRGREFL